MLCLLNLLQIVGYAPPLNQDFVRFPGQINHTHLNSRGKKGIARGNCQIQEDKAITQPDFNLDFNLEFAHMSPTSMLGQDKLEEGTCLWYCTFSSLCK